MISTQTETDVPDGATTSFQRLDGASSSAGGLSGSGAGSGQSYRTIFIKGPQLVKFCTNEISTGKYSIISFVPKFLFEQFRRYSNIFFLFISLLQQIPNVSPTGRFTTLVPLTFILAVSALKEIVEDYKRHRADDETNHREVEVLKNGRWVLTKWLKVQVGDIVKVQCNSFFPADLVIISSSEPQSMCFIETANLDGETNLKIRQALPQTATHLETVDLINFNGVIDCELPNRHLYEFAGVLKETNKRHVPLGPDQVLLRGAVLRNTSWVFAVVIYTGKDTKLVRNSTSSPLKRSTVDKLTNIQIAMLFVILLVLCLISAGFSVIWAVGNPNATYIGLEDISKKFGFNLLTFIILYNNLIPISLQVTLEMVRFMQAVFINQDVKMYHEESDTPAMARTSNLNEELGQVKYIFSDKTGTLTQNVMEYKKCAIGDNVYTVPTDQPNDCLLIQNLMKSKHPDSTLIEELLVLLSVCHTVIPEKQPDGNVIYHAASPDERALVNGARRYGYVFESRTPNSVTIDALGTRRTYKILNVIEFTSKRKCMSVIVQLPDGKIKLYTKGADSVIYERLAQPTSKYGNKLLNHLECFASEGLRTLCLAYADITPEFYDKWEQTYRDACTSLKNREDSIDEASRLIETDLKLIGATAIEDRLQDEVPETIAALLKAGINIWVLTGDKQETAINIGYSCKLIVHGMPLLIVNEDCLDKTRDTLQRHASDLGHRLGKQNELALIIDGYTLKFALSCELRSVFLDLCTSCKVVIVCRASPLQKAEVVELVSVHTQSVTLAIGDGANDVAMIKKAHVGVGISGFEGMQAACASDYSIAQFKYLLRLLLVHGAWNYSRIGRIILYSFYKNICLYVIELWFAIYSAWSGQVLFERWTISLYNVLFTAFPPLAIGLFDRPCSDETMLKYPKLYRPSQNGELFNVRVFWLWIVNSLVHSVILFWLPLFALQNENVWANGKTSDYLSLGIVVYTAVVITVCLKAGLIINTWTYLTHLAIWGSIGLWCVFVIIYSRMWQLWPVVGAVFAGQDLIVSTSVVVWLAFLVTPVIALLPDITFQVITPAILCDEKYHLFRSNPMRQSHSLSMVHTTISKSETEKVRESEILGTSYAKESSKSSLSETARLLKNVRSAFLRRSSTRLDLELELAHGYAFSQEEGASVSQTDVIRAYDTNIPKPIGL